MRTIVLSVHGLGANWLGCYGNEWVATPNLDRLAAAGTVFENHYAETLPGFDPFAKDVPRIVDKREGGPPLKGIRKNLKLPDDGLIVIESDAFSQPWFVPRELFDDYWESDENAKAITNPTAKDDWRIAQASYAAAVTYFDAEFGALRDAVGQADWIVTGTQGFPLGEHSSIGGINLHEECVHLPLILSKGSGVRIPGFTTSSDLTAIVAGTATIIRTHVVSRLAKGHSIRNANWTMIDDGELRLYTRPSDRTEVSDVSRSQPDAVEEVKRLMACL